MRHLGRFVPLVIITVVLGGCFGGGQSPSATASPSTSAAPSSSAGGSGAPSESAGPSAPSSVEPVPSDQLGAFSCDPPIHVDATVARANITDVRVGGHADYDRVVFEFEGGIPEASIERATPPFTHDASGAPIDVQGTSFIRVILRGGTKQTLDGTSSYDGPTDFDPALPAVVDLIEGGDFEAQSTWYLGLTAESCIRVIDLTTSDGPPRLIIDVEH
jgi:hypothetical protein